MQIFSINARRSIDLQMLTITGLAEQIGMHRQELSKILNCRVDPTTATLARIADGLGLPLWKLFKPEA